MASFTIVGNNIHSGNRSGSIIFTSTDRGALKREYMRLAFSRPVAPVAPVAPATQSRAHKAAVGQRDAAMARVAELEARIDELVDRLEASNTKQVNITALYNHTLTIIDGYTARKNSAPWKAGLKCVTIINEQLVQTQ